jgi:hypothetical protein
MKTPSVNRAIESITIMTPVRQSGHSRNDRPMGGRPPDSQQAADLRMTIIQRDCRMPIVPTTGAQIAKVICDVSDLMFGLGSR